MNCSIYKTSLFLIVAFFLVSALSSCGLVETRSVDTYHASVMFVGVPDTVRAGERADVTIYGRKNGDRLHQLKRSSDNESTTFAVIMEGEEPDLSILWCGTGPHPVLAETDIRPKKSGIYSIRVLQPDETVMERVLVVE